VNEAQQKLLHHLLYLIRYQRNLFWVEKQSHRYNLIILKQRLFKHYHNQLVTSIVILVWGSVDIRRWSTFF